jgi:hypothetical protein
LAPTRDARQQNKNNHNFNMTDSFKCHKQTSAIKTREVNQSTFPAQYPPKEKGRKWIIQDKQQPREKEKRDKM